MYGGGDGTVNDARNVSYFTVVGNAFKNLLYPVSNFNMFGVWL